MDPVTLVAALAAVPYAGPFLPYLPLVFLFCAMVDAAVPQPAEGSAWVPVRRVVHVLGLNVANARNAVPAGAVPAAVAQHAAEVQKVAAAVAVAAGELKQAAAGVPEAVAGEHRP